MGRKRQLTEAMRVMLRGTRDLPRTPRLRRSRAALSKLLEIRRAEVRGIKPRRPLTEKRIRRALRAVGRAARHVFRPTGDLNPGRG